MEANSDGRLHSDGLAVFHAGLEAPLADRFDGLFVQAEAELARDLDVLRYAFFVDYDGEPNFALVLGLARFFGIFRLGFECREEREVPLSCRIGWTFLDRTAKRLVPPRYQVRILGS